MKHIKTLVGDFETTVYDEQTYTEVWASACVELGTEDVHIFNSIDETFKYLVSLKTNVIIYYHNLKFDGSFWLPYLLQHAEYEHALERLSENENDIQWVADKYMKSKTFKYAISDMGQWYFIKIKVGKYMIEIRDSLKLLPFSVKQIGKAFNTKHQKLDMEYKGFRYAGCTITDEEKEYIANDVLVVKEALEIMFSQGHDKLTIGACCLQEYKNSIIFEKYEELFPNLYDIAIDSVYDSPTAGDYIRRAYRGGWCYLVKGKENKIYEHGTTADVNSLYPSMMSSESGNVYPVSVPHFWRGNYIPEKATKPNRYYYVRVRTRFYLKPDMLPFIQIKHNLMYLATECLVTSDIIDRRTGQYVKGMYDSKGNYHDTIQTLTLTMTDFQLIKEHYNLVDFEILDGCWFLARKGIFDQYIEKYKKIKLESKGALRTLAKLFLNNLYGKMATSMNSNFKVAYIKDDGALGFKSYIANDKIPGYIAVGAAITSYARNFTIRAAQKNYHGVQDRGFIYADTDSIHCDLEADEIVGIKVDDKAFCCWKLESSWDTAIFVRQKTYIEHIVAEDLNPIERPYNNIKCAGMPDKCKRLLDYSMTTQAVQETDTTAYTEEELEFIQEKRDITDFKRGLKVPGKLLPKRIKGGIILKDTPYEMR